MQGDNEVGEESNGLIVLRFKREPGDGRARGSLPLGKQGRFPKTGRSRDERERACYSLLESLDEVGARHQLGTWTRRMQLGR